MRRLLVPLLLGYVSRWVEAQERLILAKGVPLSGHSLADAQRLGVRDPERVRLLSVPKVPHPGGAFIDILARWVGMPSDNTAGLTTRYGIFIRASEWGDRRLLAHELAHTAQYERLGGIRPFLRQYLTECLTSGYAGAALELEAQEAEATIRAQG